MQADLLEIAALGKAGRPLFHQHKGNALSAGRRIGLGGNDDDPRILAVGYKCLAAIEHVVVAVTARQGTQRLQVASSTGFGQGQRADAFAAHHPRQPAGLGLFVAVGKDVRGRNVGVEREPDGGGIHAGQLLDDDRRKTEIGTRAPVLRRQHRTQQTTRSRFAPQIARDDAIALPLRVMRNDFLLDEAPHLVPE